MTDSVTQAIRLDGYKREPAPDPSLLEDYNLAPSGREGRFVCIGCGLEYVTLEDRMLRPAHVCAGCMQRAGQG